MTPPLLEIEGLRVDYPVGTTWLGRPAHVVRAVDGVDLELAAGETLGLVGESGSGKTTIGRAILGLEEPTAGTIRFDGTDVTSKRRSAARESRRGMHAVFQDPHSSLDPSWVVRDLVAEPLDVRGRLGRTARETKVVELLERVGLSADHLDRHPHEFSGGQRQRIAIARALATGPQLIVCDEAVSALDVSTQSQVINLLEDLQEAEGVAYLFISHDLSVVRHISDRIAVLYLGSVVESGPAERVHHAPAHPYTQALLRAVPVPDPAMQRRRRAERRQLAPGEIPDPTAPPPGCRFHTRCPHVMDLCRQKVPVAREVDGGGTVACHLPAPSTPVPAPTRRLTIPG